MEKHNNKMKYLNAEVYYQVLGKEKDPDVLEYIEKTVKTCCDYVAAVDMMETQLITARMRMDQDRYQEFIMNIDGRRRAIHNDAIASVGFLNRVAKANGLSDIFVGDDKDRYQVADFCLEIVTDIFNKR